MSRVYIGKLSYRAREKDVEKFFKGYGKILEVDLKNGYGGYPAHFVAHRLVCYVARYSPKYFYKVYTGMYFQVVAF